MADPCTITHIEIPAPDLEKAVSFYSQIFGWTTFPMEEGFYTLFKIGSSNSGGGFDATLKPAEQRFGPQLVIDVDDIQAKLEEIKEHGGQVIKEKTEIQGDHGFYAVFMDPNGNYMQIHSRT